MAVLNVAVILWACPAPPSPLQLHDKAWYEDYFFSPLHGHAAYWLKQSDHAVQIVGDVFDWTFDALPTRDFSNRNATLKLAVEHLEEHRDVDFEDYNCIVVLLGVPPVRYKTVDGGTGSVKVDGDWRRGIVTRLEDPFDFISHELGHALGLEHSFTWDESVQFEGDGPGGYGHPHCIMSAMVYGDRRSEARHDAPLPLGSHLEYRSIGPGVNGVTARARGWIDAHHVVLDPNFAGDFELRSRQWGGRDPARPPQAIHLTRPDGASFVVDFYEPLWWDSALPSARLVLTQDRGGLADKNYPGKSSGTFLASLPIPVGGLDTRVKPPPGTGFTVLALHHDAERHVLKVRIVSQPVGVPAITVDVSEQTESTPTGVRGTATFRPGERFCIEGEFEFEELVHRTIATVRVEHPLAFDGGTVTWKIDGIALGQSVGTMSLVKTVFVVDAKRTDLTALRTVVIQYRSEAAAGGARLLIANRPEDESFSVDIKAVLQTTVAVGAASTAVKFTGREFRFGDAYRQQFTRCSAAFLRRKVKDAQTLVVFDPKQRLEFAPGREVVGWLNGLTSLHAQGDRAQYEAAASMFRRELGVPDLQLTTIEATDVIRVAVPEKPIAPPADRRETPVAAPAEPRSSGRDDFRRGALMGLIAGAVVAGAIAVVVAWA